MAGLMQLVMVAIRHGLLAPWRTLATRMQMKLQSLMDPGWESGSDLLLAHSSLEALSPFYMVLNSRGVAVSSGSSLRLFLQVASLNGAPLDTLFVERDGAEGIELSAHPLATLEGRLLRLEAKTRPGLEFAGQLIPAWSGSRQELQAHQPAHWILDLRPILETLDDLEASGLSLQDLSLLDPMRVSMVTMLMETSLRQELLNGLSVGLPIERCGEG